MKIPTLIENKKEQFGTYSVMALLNAQTALDHIQKLIGIDIPCNSDNTNAENSTKKNNHAGEENLWQHPVLSFLWNDGALYPELAETVKNKLFSYFPFLRIMAEQRREFCNKKNRQNRLGINTSDITYVLDKMLRVLKKYRDTTSHFIIADSSWDDGSDFLKKHEQVAASMINNYFTVAIRNTANRYGYSTDNLAFIQNYRYKPSRNEQGHRTMIINQDFFLSLMANNGDADKKNLHLSGVGVAQLICLFLEKQYINLFLTHLPIFENYSNDAEECRIIRRAMGINSIVLPKDRIQSVKSNMSVAMDILNEVKRCPSELFDVISPDDQARFRLTSSDLNEVLMKRSSDRFAQLVLQHIDYGNLFNDIRFHVNMGKLRYLFNPSKTCIDGQTRVRVLEHRLNGFGRLQEVEDARKAPDGTFLDSHIMIRDFENVQRDDTNPANYPYIIDTYTRYILEGNKVEMTFGNVTPQIEESDGKWYAGNSAPDCRMSIFELPAMAFHMHLLGSEKTEERIKEVYNKYIRLYKAMSRGEVTTENLSSFGIAECDLTQKMLDCLNGCAAGKSMNTYIKRMCNEMLVDTQLRLDRLTDDKKTIRSAANKMGKRNFRQIQPGKIADFIAKDIVKFQPITNNGVRKLTGMNYRVMQSAIATYNSMGDNEAKLRFRQIFAEAGLIGSDATRRHAFLFRVFNYQLPEDTINFYHAYLKERQKYLKGVIRNIEEGNNVSVPFVNSSNSEKKNKWRKPTLKYLVDQYIGLDDYDKLPVELPRQMFDDDIKHILKSKFPQMADIDFEQANVTYLIGEYIKRVLGDDFQQFYSWKRNYSYIDMLKCETNDKGSLCHSYTTVDQRESLWANRMTLAESYRKWAMQQSAQTSARFRMQRPDNATIDNRLSNARNFYQKCEKAIRRYKVQDTLLFLMAKDVLTKQYGVASDKFSLREIRPDADKGILSETMPLVFSFKKGDQEYTITSSGMKLKNYGDFFALVNDKRLHTLYSLLDCTSIDKDDLTEEFNRYNQCRTELVSMVFDIEKWAFAKYPQLAMKLYSDKVQFVDILNEICNDDMITTAQREILRVIRNAFNHNFYPNINEMQVTTLPEIAQNIKEMFGEYAVFCKK